MQTNGSAIIKPPPAVFRIRDDFGRELFSIDQDGNVTGRLEDAGPAAAAFVMALEAQLSMVFGVKPQRAPALVSNVRSKNGEVLLFDPPVSAGEAAQALAQFEAEQAGRA